MTKVKREMVKLNSVLANINEVVANQKGDAKQKLKDLNKAKKIWGGNLAPLAVKNYRSPVQCSIEREITIF